MGLKRHLPKWLAMTLLILLGASLFVVMLPRVSAWSLGNAGLDGNLTFDTNWDGTGNGWSVETTTWFWGGSAAQSGQCYPGSQSYSYIDTYVYGPGHLYFEWKASCSADSYLVYSDAEGSKASIHGEVGWTWMDIFVPPGGQTIKWTFYQGQLQGGANACWLDDVNWKPTMPILAVRGTNNQIYYQVYNEPSETWGGWLSLPSGSTSDSPAAAINFDNFYDPNYDTTSLVFVVRGMDGTSLWYSTVDLDWGGFSGWNQIDGSTNSAPTLVSNGTNLCLVVRGLDNRIYYRLYENLLLGHYWTPWKAIPTGTTCDSPAAALIGNDLHVVVRSMDGSSLWWTTIQVTDNTVIHSWKQLDGSTPSKPVLVSAQDPENPTVWPTMIHLVVRGMNNNIYERWWWPGGWAPGGVWIPGGWNTWTQVPGSTIDGPTAFWYWAYSPNSNWLHLVVRDANGNRLWHTHEGDNTWTLLSGSTPSAPTAAGCC